MLRNETCKRSVSFWVKRVNKSHIPFKIPSALHHSVAKWPTFRDATTVFPAT